MRTHIGLNWIWFGYNWRHVSGRIEYELHVTDVDYIVRAFYPEGKNCDVKMDLLCNF